ncbi:MAG: bifunctional glycosyltransferase family 2/GtrA family protein [Microbacterium sp.]|uniref:bifunctional glycosyltransferase family 2/GtrA family protein n=1 Tax=Microbacterium sp. TaxID=51671 RepID=UPI00262AB2DE|nr:bifunctional glycosyltransferase family 2/GtrA family protein [Microbacterium sp.]MCX6502231.1 bifunctional glycosyltransferase family 2/GtrA family protein [Microbacterium sp.]
MIVLVPAYEPGAALPSLVTAVRDADADTEVVVVDDGSGPSFDAAFADAERRGATVLRHPANRGKGAAIKSGLDHVLEAHPAEDVVTADADGQHTVRDIVRVADALREDAVSGRAALVLGCRGFSGRVPLRSRIGNGISRRLFRAAAGWRLSDTQTGLRGIPADVIPWMRDQPGERFEYEQNVLLRSHRDGVETRELQIDTVYLDDNASSHFRPVTDSLRVALPLVLFAGSSLVAFTVDTLALLLFTTLTGWLVPSIIAARLLSASVNFATNRRFVFPRHTRGRLTAASRYALLAVALLASNIVWIDALTRFGLPLVLAKITTEIVLFVTSYGVQKTFVFGPRTSAGPAGTGHSRRIAKTGAMDSEAFTTGRNH